MASEPKPAEQDFYGLLREAINRNEHRVFKEILLRGQLNKLDLRVTEKLKRDLCFLIYRSKAQRNIINTFFNHFTETVSQYVIGKVTVLGSVLRDEGIKIEYKEHIIRTLRVSYRAALIAGVTSNLSTTDQYFDQLDQIYGYQSRKDYQSLIEYFGAEPKINDIPIPLQDRSYLDNLDQRLQEVQKYARVPDYINMTKKTFSELVQSVEPVKGNGVVKMPTPHKLASLIVKTVQQKFETVSDDQPVEIPKKKLVERLKTLGPLAYYQSINQVLSQYLVDEDELAATVYGPVNPIFLMYDDQEEIDLEFGGYRMLTTIAYDQDYDQDYDQVYYPQAWFTGKCDFCLKKIRIYQHAVRMPVLMGGWEGCYCCWDCVRKDVPDAVVYVEVGQERVLAGEAIEFKGPLINHFEMFLLEHGITVPESISDFTGIEAIQADGKLPDLEQLEEFS